ncbi:MAG: peptide-methionine (S)-S-oxide reductase MsrA [Rhodocyclaceae bacterium]
MNTQTAIFAGGCFWCLEAVYEEVDGVKAVASGYTDGNLPDPDYETVCTGTTGHAEAVRIVFDADVVSYRELLEVFFVIHDPTQLNRQGNDVGTQYRSAIYWTDEAQRNEAEQIVAELTERHAYDRPIVTVIAPASQFYDAEAYHREYFRRHPEQAYCTYVVAPKLEKFRKTFARLRKPASN